MFDIMYTLEWVQYITKINFSYFLFFFPIWLLQIRNVVDTYWVGSILRNSADLDL